MTNDVGAMESRRGALVLAGVWIVKPAVGPGMEGFEHSSGPLQVQRRRKRSGGNAALMEDKLRDLELKVQGSNRLIKRKL